MGIIETHIHLYSDEYKADRNTLIQQAIDSGVEAFYMPNLDVHSIESMYAVEKDFPDHCFAMMGLHPCYVKEDYKEQLAVIEQELKRRRFVAIGEVGIDLHWDKSFLKQQQEALAKQAEWALTYNVPIVIHSREANTESLEVLMPFMQRGLKGVFHCFSGSIGEVTVLKSYGWMIGIGGVVTYKKSGLDALIEEIGISQVVLETDGPYLSPVPHRGKRNEPIYINEVAQKIGDILEMSKEAVIEQTTTNSRTLFRR